MPVKWWLVQEMVNDAERSPKPVLTVKECFAHSSNVGMSKLAYKAFGNNPKKFKEYLHHYSLDVRSPIDLTDVPKPQLASFEKNTGGTDEYDHDEFWLCDPGKSVANTYTLQCNCQQW